MVCCPAASLQPRFSLCSCRSWPRAVVQEMLQSLPQEQGMMLGVLGGQRALPGLLAEPRWASLLLKLLALGWRKGQPGVPPSAGSIPGSQHCCRALPHRAGPWGRVSMCPRARHAAGAGETCAEGWLCEGWSGRPQGPRPPSGERL